MGEWSGPEVVTALLAGLTPLAVVALGVLVTQAGRRIEAVQWANQMVVARRLELFAQVAPGINQLLCFATFVGRWKEITPAQATAIKRDLDEIMYANKVLFSAELFTAYEGYLDTLFATYTSRGRDAPLRVSIDSSIGDRRDQPWWTDSMTALFVTTGQSSVEDIRQAHDRLSDALRADLYVTGIHRPLLNTG